MRVSYNTWPAYPQFHKDNSTATWPKGIQHITPFTEESTGDTDSIWTLFSHTGVYVMAIRSLIPAGLGIFSAISFGVNLPD